MTDPPKGVLGSLRMGLGRVKERLLQNMGKVDRSRDDTMEEYVNNFEVQKKSINKVHDELRTYAYCARATESSLKHLIELLSLVYNDSWVDKESLISQLQQLQQVHEGYTHKLQEDILKSVDSYVDRFPNVTHKVSQLSNSLVDYDHARHRLQELQVENPNTELLKLSKAKIKVQEAWDRFEPLHAELVQELPSLFDSRIPFYAESLKNLFTAEMAFHTESGSIFSRLSQVMDALAAESKQGSYDTLRKPSVILPPPPVSNEKLVEDESDKKPPMSEQPEMVE